MKSETRKLSLSEIRANPVALRGVNPESEDFKELVASIRAQGVLQTISVRPRTETDDDTGETESFFEIIDGLQRFSAAKEAGLDEIDVIIRDVQDDNVVLAQQIIGNLHRIEMKPAQYSEQLKRMLNNDPLLTIAELGKQLGKSKDWIEKRLALGNIEAESIRNLIDDGKITLANAYVLSKLPASEQAQYVETAMTADSTEFAANISEVLRELRKEQRGSKKSTEFAPVPSLRKLKDLQEILEQPNFANKFVESAGVTDTADAVVKTLKFVIQLDDESVAKQKERYEERKSINEARRKERQAERADERAHEARVSAAEAKQAAGEELTEEEAALLAEDASAE